MIPRYGRARVLERLFGGVAPRLKCLTHIAAFVMFLAFFTAVFFGLHEDTIGVAWAGCYAVEVEAVFW